MTKLQIMLIEIILENLYRLRNDTLFPKLKEVLRFFFLHSRNIFTPLAISKVIQRCKKNYVILTYEK